MKVVEQNQMEDPVAMSLASLVMSRPGSVMDDRPGSAMSILSGISPTKTPVRNRKLRNDTSVTNIESNSRGEIYMLILLVEYCHHDFNQL